MKFSFFISGKSGDNEKGGKIFVLVFEGWLDDGCFLSLACNGHLTNVGRPNLHVDFIHPLTVATFCFVYAYLLVDIFAIQTSNEASGLDFLPQRLTIHQRQLATCIVIRNIPVHLSKILLTSV